MEWVTEEKMPCLPVEFDVWLTDNSVRRVRHAQTCMGGTIQFLDCTHPAQNAACSPLRIQGWKIADQGVSQP